MHDVLFVSGTRPEIIKLAPLYHRLRSERWARPHWLHTGQHAGMADPMLDCFDLRPDIRLDRHGSELHEFSIGCRQQLEGVMRSRRWSMVVVQGDTESTFLGALGGFQHQVPVVHVEAGLRTNNLARPFPEEGLRQMISRIARLHCAPTERAARALREEAIPAERIAMTGNTVIDAQQWACARHGIQRTHAGDGHVLVTMHRREHWGDDVEQVCHAIAAIASMHPERRVLFPVHLNPVIQQPVRAILGGLANVDLVAPFDYLQMQRALADAALVLTDSGGLQEEAPTFGVPLLVLRAETERPEAIDAGCARLVGVDPRRIVAEVESLLGDELAYRRMQRAGNPFGDGHACERIVARMADLLDVRREDAAMAVE